MQLTTKETIKFILRSLQDSKTLFFIFVSLVLIFSLYESTLAYGIKILIDNFDNVTDEQFMNNLYKSGIKITIIVIIFEIIQKTFSFIWNVKLSSILYKNIVTRCFTEILKKQYIFFNKTLSGNITSKIDDLGNSTVKIILLVIDSIIYNIFLISSCAIAIFISNKECGFSQFLLS